MIFSIGSRLAGGFGGALAIVLACNLFSWIWLNGASRHVDESVAALAGSAALADAQSTLWELRYGFPQFMLSEAPGRAKIAADEPKLRARLDERLAAYAALPKAADEAQALTEPRAVYTRYMDARPKWLELYGAGRIEQAKEWRAATTTPFGAGMVKAISTQIELQKKASAVQQASAKAAMLRASVQLAAVSALSALLLLVFAWLLTRSITRSLGAVRAGVAAVQNSGDLTQRVPVEGRDEVAVTAGAFNLLMDSLQATLRKVLEGAQQVSATASTVANASGQVQASSRDQAESAASTAAAVEQVTVTLGQVADSTREASTVSAQASTLSSEGEKAARSAADGMTLTVASVALVDAHHRKPVAPLDRHLGHRQGDQRDRGPNQSPGIERRHRGGARRRAGPRFRGGGRRSAETGWKKSGRCMHRPAPRRRRRGA